MFFDSVFLSGCNKDDFKYSSYSHETKSGVAAHVIGVFARATLAVSGIFLGVASAWTFSHFALGTTLFIGGVALPGGLAIMGGAAALFAISYFFHSLCDRRGTV